MRTAICIDDEGFENFVTKGKCYPLRSFDEESFQILGAKDQPMWFSAHRFKMLEDFKVGEWIVCESKKDYPRSLTVGREYKVRSVNGRGVCVEDDAGHIWTYDSVRFKKQEKDMSCKCRQDAPVKEWSFTVTSELAIDFDDIISALSYAEPLALVDAGDNQYAVIHDTVMHKSIHCKGKLRLPKDCREQVVLGNDDVGLVIQLNAPCGRKSVVEFVKAVKDASWKKRYQGRQEVTVILPKV